MSDKAKEYLENYDPQIKEVGYDNYFYSPKQVIERMQSYADQESEKRLEDVLVEVEKEIDIKSSQIKTITGRIPFKEGAKWLLNLLKQRK